MRCIGIGIYIKRGMIIGGWFKQETEGGGSGGEERRWTSRRSEGWRDKVEVGVVRRESELSRATTKE